MTPGQAASARFLPLQVPPVTVSCDKRPLTGVCTVCDWSEETASESPDMMELLWKHAREHALQARHEVTVTTMSVMTFSPA